MAIIVALLPHNGDVWLEHEVLRTVFGTNEVLNKWQLVTHIVVTHLPGFQSIVKQIIKINSPFVLLSVQIQMSMIT